MVQVKDQGPAPRVLRYGPEAIAAAARLVTRGIPVAVPTETVYGLAADAADARAVARIYEAKGRPQFNPLIVHVATIDQALALARFEPAAGQLAEQYWPGPLTLVLPLAEDSPIAALTTAGLPTVALRCSAHPAMRDLILASGRPLAAPSANPSGRVSPTRAEHVVAALGDRVALVIDGGPTLHGLESTIVAVADGEVRLLRPGPIDLGLAAGDLRGIEAPGQMSSHYAPAKPLRLEANIAQPDEWHIGFGAVRGDVSLSEAGDLVEAAARLFDLLHAAERSDRCAIAVAPIPESGLGIAINDRLRRAGAPRA